MKKVLPILLVVLAYLAAFAAAKAASVPDIQINEIAWMGTVNSANDEWIELKNNIAENITLNGWLLKTTDEKIKAYLAGQIPANGFYLLERTDDNSVPNVKADATYKGSLNNNGESLELYKSSNTLVDGANFSSKWTAGDNTTKQTMERNELDAWQTSKSPGGTPKAQNSSWTQENPTTPKELAPTIVIDIKPIETLPQTYPDGIVINEILPAPEGPDETNEWIELYNANNFEVDLTGWKIKDAKGSLTTYAFLEGKKMPANGYLVLKRPETKITLNNDEDTISLIFPNEKITSAISYKNAPKNQSYNKSGSDWSWNQSLTPGGENSIESALKKTEEPDNSNTVGDGLASVKDSLNKSLDAFSDKINQNGKNTLNPWFLFLIAVIITVVSAAVVLIIKIKVLKGNFKAQNPKS